MEHRLAPELPFQLRFSWSPDGRYLLVSPLQAWAPPIAKIFGAAGNPVRSLGPADLPHDVTGGGPFWATGSDTLIYAGDLVRGTDVASVWGLTLTGSAHLLWPRNPQRVTATPSLSGYSFDVTADPALNRLSLETASQRQTLFWDAKRRIGVCVDNDGTNNWHVIAASPPQARYLPYVSNAPAFMSPRFAAGIVSPDSAYIGGHIVIQSLRHPRRHVDVGVGSDPTWSRDGRWLFFVTRTKIGSYTFTLRALPLSRLHGWQKVTSPAYRISVVRVRPNGSHRQVVTSQDGYGIAQLNVVTGDRRVVFDYVPSDYNLWKHRHIRLTLARIKKYKPAIRIETAVLGHRPTTLIRRAYLPATQP